MTTRVDWNRAEVRTRFVKGKPRRMTFYLALCLSCGETRWLTGADGRRAEKRESVCRHCSQIAKAKLAYQECVSRYGNDFAIRRVQKSLLTKQPSKGEQAVIAALEKRPLAYEREVLMPETGRSWLVDFMVNGALAIEYNGGCHVLHVERDQIKHNDIRRAGFRLLVIEEDDLPNLDSILDTFLGVAS